MRYPILITFLILAQNAAQCQSLTKDQKEQIELSVNSFTSALSLFANCKGEDVVDKGLEILTHLDERLQDSCANDLFGSQIDDNSENTYWGNYLRYIEKIFHNEITMDFNNVKIINCIESGNSESFAIVSFDKYLKFKDESKTVSGLIFINLSNYKIRNIVFPYSYKGNCNFSGKNDITLNVIRAKAEKLFAEGNFVSAKNQFEILHRENMSNQEISERIKECEKFISINSYMQRADSLYSVEAFEVAIYYYKKILTEFTDVDVKLINSKIDLCTAGLNNYYYKQHIRSADIFFQRGIFNKASEFYNLALIYKPNDIYATTQLQKSKRGDPEIARNEIRKAISLAEISNKNWGVAFKIMLQYEPSGLLNAENYYFMVMMLDGRDKRVKSEMNFKFKDFQNYLNIYALKLRTASKRENYQKGLDFLNYYLNKRYQN